jgi:hypothetical protein
MATPVIEHPDNPDASSEQSKFQHLYHADATLFHIDLEKPVLHAETHARIGLKGPHPRYDHQAMGPYDLRGLISYGSGYTHVAAHETDKAYTTLTTGAVEDLNILDVVTAERVVGQIYTEHLKLKDSKDSKESDPVPVVTFIGTRFEHLRICGQEINLDWDIELLGGKLKDDSDLTAEKLLGNVVQIREHSSSGEVAKSKQPAARTRSLISKISKPFVGEIDSEVEYCIFIPHFGRIFFGEVEICRVPSENKHDHDAYHVKLNMIRLAMGCIATGNGTVVALDANGKGGKGGP